MQMVCVCGVVVRAEDSAEPGTCAIPGAAQKPALRFRVTKVSGDRDPSAAGGAKSRHVQRIGRRVLAWRATPGDVATGEGSIVFNPGDRFAKFGSRSRLNRVANPQDIGQDLPAGHGRSRWRKAQGPARYRQKPSGRTLARQPFRSGHKTHAASFQDSPAARQISIDLCKLEPGSQPCGIIQGQGPPGQMLWRCVAQHDDHGRGGGQQDDSKEQETAHISILRGRRSGSTISTKKHAQRCRRGATAPS